MIEVENLVKRYGGHTAVDHLTFHVEKGQIYGFLGPNGAGKTTTMNMMTGYLAATEGTVKINGFDILKQPEEAKSCIGYLPEIPPLYPDMTVLEYLKFAAELKRIPKAERQKRIGDVMDRTGIEEVSGRLIKNLSKGFRQRVGLAQAILSSPEVIILDEPTVGLDPKQIIEIRDLIRELGREHTVILSSHILSEVSAVCDHIMIISNGKLVASDSPEGLQKRMDGRSGLKITVIGTKEETRKALEKVPGIEDISYIAGSEPDTVDISVEAAAGTDLRRAVGKALVASRLPVLSMSSEEKTLEDIFLTLTSAEKSGASEAENGAEVQAVPEEAKEGFDSEEGQEGKADESNI